MGDKIYTSVEDMVRDLTEDAEVIDAVDNALDRQKVVRKLMAMRAVRGFSQGDIAEAMGCTQSRVSKMESSSDDALRYGDLRQYAEAVGCELITGLKPGDLLPADEVKALAFAINDRLSRMVDISRDDEEIAGGVAQFFFEAFINFSMIFGRVATALPKNSDGSPRFAVHVDVQQKADCPSESKSAKNSEASLAASE